MGWAFISRALRPAFEGQGIHIFLGPPGWEMVWEPTTSSQPPSTGGVPRFQGDRHRHEPLDACWFPHMTWAGLPASRRSSSGRAAGRPVPISTLSTTSSWLHQLPFLRPNSLSRAFRFPRASQSLPGATVALVLDLDLVPRPANSFCYTRRRSFRQTRAHTHASGTRPGRSNLQHPLSSLTRTGAASSLGRRDKLATATLAAVDIFPGYGLGPMHPSPLHHLLSHESGPHEFQQQQHHHSSYAQHGEPSPPYSSPSANHSPRDQFEIPPAKRQKLASPARSEPDRAPAKRGATARMSAEPVFRHDKPGSARGPAGGGGGEGRTAATTSTPVVAKSRRVRTGCLTCRERHLKCDEGTPDCNNCRKSNRECKRGLRLNFIDTQVKDPPMVPPTSDWSVQFHDESRMIASEYRGGLGRYPRAAENITPPREVEPASAPPSQPRWNHQVQSADPAPFQDSYAQRRQASDAFLPAMAPTPVLQAPPAPPAPSVTPNRSAMLLDQYVMREDAFRRSQGHRFNDFSSLPSPCFPPNSGLTPGAIPDGLMTPPTEKSTGEREYLSTEDEIRFMQAYTDSVAIWMDVMDKEKHFSRVLPYLALQSPMLLNALLACGAKHLSLVEGHGEDKAHYYYDVATKALLMCLKNPDRNTGECATTAVILNVYEIMNERPNQRMSHIAGARALIRECGWDATAPGISGACFWVNIGMEVLSCLAFNWQTAWDPDQWGLDLEFTNWTPTPRTGGSVDGDRENLLKPTEGDEELWVHRILYILAKVTNFHATIPRFQEASPHDEQVRRQSRFNEWKRLKGLCDAWNSNCPRSMQPYGYCHTPSSTSLFPRVWLVKRPAILGRLFYHTAMCLLAQINPMEPRDSEDNVVSQLLHAHHTCGIIAHTRDPAIASGALRSLAVAGAVLTDRQEQMEVLAIMERTSKETGWRLGRIVGELKATWGWESTSTSSSRTLNPLGGHGSSGGGGSGGSLFGFSPHLRAEEQSLSPLSRNANNTPTVAAPTPLKPTVNPLLANADFGKKNHPYQNWYEPPNRTGGAGGPAVWPA